MEGSALTGICESRVVEGGGGPSRGYPRVSLAEALPPHMVLWLDVAILLTLGKASNRGVQRDTGPTGSVGSPVCEQSWNTQPEV